MRSQTFLTLLLLTIALSVAQINTYTVDQEMNITLVCKNAGYCSNTSYCNINVVDPNSDIVIEGQNMTMNPTIFYYNYTPVTLGRYNVGGVCVDGSDSEEIDFVFDVTSTGESITTGGAILYTMLLVGSLILFSFSFYWMLRLKFGNFFDYESGELLGRNDWKYLKLFLIPVNYVLLMWIFGIARSIAANYLHLAGLSLIFNWAYWIMLSLVFPFIIVGLYFLLVLIINDKKINDSLKRGSPLNGP